MKKIKKGDIVGRLSYGKDIFFVVEKIIKLKNKRHIAILKGLTIRVKADSPIEDLERLNKYLVKKEINHLENRILKRLNKYENRDRKLLRTGKVLHLDGDYRYSQKSIKYYKELGINAIVRNIPENKQHVVIKNLLDKYRPDILIITGHDALIKPGTDINNIYNYRNSSYFIKTVRAARDWEQNSGKLAIFAGACQSYYEAIINSGANFASSPERILIDFVDPLIVAENVAYTDKKTFVKITDFDSELRDGQRGISGIGCMGTADLDYYENF